MRPAGALQPSTTCGVRPCSSRRLRPAPPAPAPAAAPAATAAAEAKRVRRLSAPAVRDSRIHDQSVRLNPLACLDILGLAQPGTARRRRGSRMRSRRSPPSFGSQAPLLASRSHLFRCNVSPNPTERNSAHTAFQPKVPSSADIRSTGVLRPFTAMRSACKRCAAWTASQPSFPEPCGPMLQAKIGLASDCGRSAAADAASGAVSPPPPGGWRHLCSAIPP
jgi:hypothetical protein